MDGANNMVRGLLLMMGVLVMVDGNASQAAPVSMGQAQAALDKNDFKAALPILLPLAQSGDAKAQYNLGVMYAGGLGIGRDEQAAVSWYAKSAAQGYAPAQTNLGLMYEGGRGVPRDYKEAMHWYLRAAKQDNPMAQNNLGSMYLNGESVEKDYQKAVEWFQKAAERGVPAAENSLGGMYVQGLGVQKDPRKGLALIMHAAESGLQIAQANALQIMVSEAHSGDTKAMYNVAALCFRGWGGSHRPDECLQWYELAAQHGLEAARSALADIYENGKFGVPTDQAKARYWRAQINNPPK
jgi:TPR repeat protein